MAIGGDIPPEVLRDIVLEACEDAYHGRLLDPFGMTVPNRKEAIKNITACSLTCVYWAQICRQRLFSRVGIKNYEDMCAYASLVSSTPTGLLSISEYARAATLVQRVEERPWLHLVRMQPSLFRFWLLRRVHIRFHIVDSPEDAASSQRSTLHRLFASLPRTLFSSCLQCSSLVIANSRFVAPQDLSTFLQKCQYGTLSLTDVTWDVQTRLESDSLTTDPLSIPSTGSRCGVQAQCSKYSAETAWLAFTATLRYLPKQVSTVPSLARYGESKPALQVLPSAQRTILDICKSLCQGRKLPFVFFVHYIMPVVETPFADILDRNTRAYLYYICSMAIREYETARESGKILYEISLAFYKLQVAISGTNANNPIVVDHISVICAQIKYFGGSIGVRVAFPWEEVVRLCAAQPAFTRLQLLFLSHDQLVQFMETQRAALHMLDGRISLFYNAETGTRAADFETLADIGDAKEHAYVHSY